MGSFEATLLRGIGVLAVASIVSACGGGDSHRNVIPTDAGDAGKTSPHLDGGGASATTQQCSVTCSKSSKK